MGLHPGCTQGQGQGHSTQRSRDTNTCNFTKIASCRQIAGSRPKLHTTVRRRARIHDVLKVKVKGHVIRTLFWLHENRFFYHKHDSIAAKLAHDGPQMGLHPECAQGQGQGQRSRDTGTSVMSRNVCYTVRSHVLSLHALTLWITIILSFQYKYQAARCLNIGMSYSVTDGLVCIVVTGNASLAKYRVAQIIGTIFCTP